MLTDPQEDYKKGWVPFLGQKIFLNSKPLIPRPETEFWVDKALKEIVMIYHNKPIKALDLFAGSGAIGVAVLAKYKNAHVTFGEIEKHHLPTIEKSLKENDIDLTRAILIETDVWSNIEGNFDVILANPPYISKERNTVHSSVLEHEPHEALFAENDGLSLIEKTIGGLPSHLNKGGIAWIEHEPFQIQHIRTFVENIGLSLQTFPDQYGLDRVTKIS